jgi:hypothetical protein
MTEVPLNLLLEANFPFRSTKRWLGNELGRVQMRLIEFIPIWGARGSSAALRASQNPLELAP